SPHESGAVDKRKTFLLFGIRCRSWLPGRTQRSIQDGVHFLLAHSSGYALAVDEHGRRGVHPQLFSLGHRRANLAFVLLLNTSLKLLRVQLMLLRLILGGLVEISKSVRLALAADSFLVAVDVVGKVPVRLVVLLCQAVCVHRRMHGPGMNLHEW